MIRVMTPRTRSVSPNRERATSGDTASVGKAYPDRRRGLGRRVGVRRLVATPQTSTTTGKTIGRRFVCSYRKRDTPSLI